MAGAPEKQIRIRQFGGLRLDTPPSDAVHPIHDCVDCLNVHTAHGGIEVRPGYVLHCEPNTSSGDPRVVKGFELNDEGFIFTWALEYESPDYSAKLRLWDGSGGASIAAEAVDFEGSPGIASLETYGRALYVAYKSAVENRKIYRYDSTWYSERIGIAPPAADTFSLHEDDSGGSLDGRYSWRLCYYNERTGTESGPCSTTVDSINFGGILTNGRVFLNVPSRDDVVATGDEQVLRNGQSPVFRLYRRRVTNADGDPIDSTWYRVYTGIATATDIIVDDGLSANKDDGELNTVTEIPPTSNHICAYKRRMWWVTGLESNLVRYSEVDEPERVNPTHSYMIGASRDRITGLYEAFGRLLVFKRHSLWAITGSSDQSFVVSRVDARAGCVSEHTICEINGTLYWVGEQGVYSMNAAGVQNISDKVNPITGIFRYNRLSRLTATHDTVRGLYIINGANADDESPRQLIYDYQRGNWHLWNLPFSAIGDYESGGTARLLGVHLESNWVCSIEGSDDAALDDPPNGDPVPIQWHWTTPASDLGIIRPKQFYFLSADTNSSPHVWFNNVLLGRFDSDHPQTVRLAHIARRAQFKLGTVDGTGETAPAGVTSLEIDAEVMGWR